MKIVKMYVCDMLAEISRIALLSSLVCSYRLLNMHAGYVCALLGSNFIAIISIIF